MLSLLLSLPALATGLPPGFDQEIASRELILHGIVGQQQQCISADGRDALSFLELLPRTTPLGPPLPSSFWIPFLGGTFPDGSVAAVYGQPLLSKGEEVVLLLDNSEDGSPELLSLPSAHSLYRVVSLDTAAGGDGDTAVVDGEGFVLLRAKDGLRRGPRLAAGKATLPFGDPIDYARLADELRALADRVVAPLANEPWPGSWTGTLRLSSDESGLACTAVLTGEALPTGELNLEGRCNLPYIGASDIGMEAVYTVGGWSGSLSVLPENEGWEGRSFVLGAEGGQDSLVASFATSETVDGRSLSAGGELVAAFAGVLTLATREDLIAWIDEAITRTGATGGPVLSAKDSVQSCSTSIQPLPLNGD